MADITGARLTTNVSFDQLQVDIGKEISLLEPSEQPLTVFTRNAGERPTVATKFSWMEMASEPRFDAINLATGYTATATSIVVDNGSYFAEHYLVLVTRTGEMMRVTGVATNTLTVVRGVGSTAAALVDNDELLVIGVAQPENDTSRPARSWNPVKRTNNTQIFREPFQASGSWLASGNQTTPMDWPLQQRLHGIEHAKNIEYSMIFGRASVDVSGSSERRTTGGVLSFITANQTDAGGDLTEAEFNGAMSSLFRFGSRRKLAIGSATAVNALNKFPLAKLNVNNQSDQTYGIDVTGFRSPFGTLNLVYHRLLEGAKYGGYLIIVDMDETSYRYLANGQFNRNTKLNQNIQAPDLDGRKDEFLTECGLEFGQPRTHGLITGITS